MRRNLQAFARRFIEVTAGETQQQTAARLGRTQGYVSNLRRAVGQPGMETVFKIAEVYGGDVEEWLTLTGYRDGKGLDRLMRGLYELGIYSGHVTDLEPADITPQVADQILAEVRARVKKAQSED